MSIRRNAIYNLAGSIVPLAVSLATIPIYLSLIGESRYGVLAVAWLLLGYFGLFDLGLGRAISQSLASLRNAASNKRADLFWTALVLNFSLGTIGGLLLWPVATYFFAEIFSVEESLRTEVITAAPLLALAVPVSTLSGVVTGGLQGRERFLELNLISSVGAILFQILPLGVAAFWTVDLKFLLCAAIFARLLTLFFLYLVCHKNITSGHPFVIVKSKAMELLRFGGWVTVTSFVGPAMVILDRLIIGSLSGAKAVSFYTVPFQLGERSTVLSTSLVSALFPRFAASSRSEEVQLALTGMQLLVFVTTPLFAIGIVFIEPFLVWWINDAFASQAVPVAQILLVGFWINSFAKVPYAQLQARGKPDIVAKCHLMELLPYLGLLYVAVGHFELVGAAVVFSLRVTLDFVLLSIFAGTLRSSLTLLLTPSLLLTLALWLALNDSLPQYLRIVSVIIYFSIIFSWTWRQTPATLKDLLLNPFRGIFS